MSENLGQKMRDEIIPKKISSKCCKLAFLSGVIRGAGCLTLERSGFGFSIIHSNEKLITKCADIIYVLLRVNPEVTMKDKSHTLSNNFMYELSLDASDANTLIKDLYLVDDESLPMHTIPAAFKTDCCMKSYLRGIFATTGTISIPEQSQHASRGYILELLLNDEEMAVAICELLAECGIETKVRQRKNVHAVYTKDSEKIADFCTILGASSAYFTLQDILVFRSIRNETNRSMNCTLANMDRAIKASSKHVDAIDKIEASVGLDTLDPVIRETAELRREYPSASLTELATKFAIPPSKSGLNHRLRKLLEIAEKLN
ncbi:MAG: DNA-binding protein WhiA [Bacillota bacterium]